MNNDWLYEIVEDDHTIDNNDQNWIYFDEMVEDEDPASISLCTLSAINWGNMKTVDDFKRVGRLAVRGIDALLDYQNYPVLAAELGTMKRRPLGVGIINFAYWMAKHDMTYSDPNLELIDEWTEAWSYYLIKASVELAQEQGKCSGTDETKYGLGVVPIDTRKKEVDELVPYKERMDWKTLREELKEYGIRNSTLMALMPAETSAQVSNSTNGIEPPRSLVSIKQSKHGVLKQVVPGIHKLKNKYELLWDQKSPEGYLKIMAILQKYIDQSISVNTSYNPEHFDEEKIPMSEMLKHLLLCYKYGIKNLYYFNTHDGQGEVKFDEDKAKAIELAPVTVDEEVCDSCTI